MGIALSPLLYNVGRIGATSSDTVANLAIGAQLGLGPNLPMLDASTPLTLRPVQPILLQAPTMFVGVPGFNGLIKSMIEMHAKQIDGIDLEETLEGDPVPIGNDGQNLTMPTNARRSPVNPQFTWNEVRGGLVWNIMKFWMNSIKHPDTAASGLSTLLQGGATPYSQMLWSSFTASTLFIQFDETLLPENIIAGYIVYGMYPTSTGPFGIKKMVGTSETVDRSIPFTGVVQNNAETKELARNVARLLGMHLVDFNRAPPITQMIDSVLQNTGIQAQVQNALATFGV